MGLRHGCSRLPGVLVVAAVGALGFCASALAATKTFTEAGCSSWAVPASVGSLNVAAAGAAGGSAEPGGAGGNGDEVMAQVEVAGGEVLYVCVDEGGGKGGSDEDYGEGGHGGGASGVALGEDFSAPVLVAGGGGGGGVNTEGFGGPVHAGGSGGPAGTQGGGPRGGDVEGGSSFDSEGPGGGGTGENGLVVELEPPTGGIAGAGGGGGGGYVGGGSGGKGTDTAGGSGGAGGTDLCENSEPVSSCTTNKEAGTGTGSVTITYTEPQTCTTAVGRGVYKKVPQPRLKVEDSLSTELGAPQMLHVKYESGKVRFRLIMLEKATCAGEPGNRDFHGEGSAAKGKEAGYTLSFSIYEEAGGFFFESKLMKGGKIIEASGGPLKKSTEKITG